MMRASLAIILALAAALTPDVSFALEAGDTMAAWKGASAEEKRALVTELLKRDGREGGAADVIRCLDAASSVPGHSDLPIGDVVAACAKQQGEPPSGRRRTF